jgi:AGZA family xanthine/uracil permease-like MFS transporter
VALAGSDSPSKLIECDFIKTSAFALSDAVLTYCGFMHGEAAGSGGGLGVAPAVAPSYAMVAVPDFR